MGDLRMITSAYPGKCRVCKTPHSKGDSVWWRKGEKGVVCGHCKAQEAPNTPTPSPSAPKPVPSQPRPIRKIAGKPTVIDRFGSWQEFVDVAVKSRNPEKQSTTAGKEFTGSASWEEALDLSRKGWKEIRPSVDAMVDSLDAKIAPALQPAFINYFDVSGGMVDVGRYLNGEPECMIETHLIETAKPGRVVGILVNGDFNGGTQGREIQKRGAAIVALIHTLEKMQHSTEIDVEISSLEGLTTVIRLKNADDVLDIDSLMFAIAHPSALRRIYFAYLEGHAQWWGRLVSPGSYGSAGPLRMGGEIGAAIELEGILHMSGEEWIVSELTKFGLIEEEG
jgi:hypothetical protein